MLSVRAGLTLLLFAALAICPSFATQLHRTHGSAHHREASRHGRRRLRLSFRRTHGQQAIDSDRAAEIQAALIHAKYLDGTPSRQWDAQTQAAMQKYQADHGWQTKLMPDSRALIALGLGPEHGTDAAPAKAPAAISAPAAPAESDTLASVHSISQ